jgi:uncharacterized protein (DUF58 family)
VNVEGGGLAAAATRVDPRVLERALALWLRARQLVAGLFAGNRAAIGTGHAVEFADHAPYAPGHPLRDVDWKVVARSDRLVVKRYRAERELRAHLVFDASADLGSTGRKWEQAITLAATLSAWLSGEGCLVGLGLCGGESAPSRWLPPRAGESHLARILVALAALRPAGRADLGATFAALGPRLGPRSMVLVISDFMEEPATWSSALAALVRRRADLRALQVVDRQELGLPFDGPVRLVSPEDGKEQVLDAPAARADFASAVAGWEREVRDAVRARRGRWRPVDAREDLSAVLVDVARGR